jgi:peroxiredoxin
MKTAIGILLVGILLVSFVTIKNGYEVGETVKDFSLKNIDGKTVSLSSFKDNKGLIVIFDCNTCPVSKAYNGRILALAKKYERTFPVVAINANDPEQSSGDSFDEMILYAKSHGYTFPYLQDETQNVAKTFGATNTPHVFVLSRTGSEYKVAYIGAIDNNTRDASAATKKYVEEAIDALIAGRSVATAKTKAIGCGIKWK